MFKKKDVFFTTIDQIADNLLAAAEYFSKGLNNPGNISEFAKEMKEYESKGDRFTHVIIKELNKTFITPIEREDIMALTSSLDDVLDEMEACASRFEMYLIANPDEHMKKFSNLLLESSREIQQAIKLLTNKKLLPIRPHCIRLNELENEADDLLRISIKSVFANVKDPIELIKRKEIYEMLEQATDSCEDVANTLESIIMLNS
jgi:hypothetical protein